jgi:hypothetical protein
MRAFMRLTRWVTLLVFVLEIYLTYLVMNFVGDKEDGNVLAKWFLFIALVCILSFLFMCAVNFFGFFVLRDRKDRARMYANETYHVKLEN